jgi:hypothetical protein
MAYEIKNNTGTAFKNKRKEADTHADYTGEGLVNNEPVWLNLWVKKDKSGNTYFSMSFRPKKAQEAKPAQPSNKEVENDCPF